MPDEPHVDTLTPEGYIARFRKRRLLLRQREISDLELLEALRFLRSELLAREVSVSFKPRGLPFITRCIQWLKNEQYKPVEKKKPRLVLRTKLDFYPDK